MEKVMVSRIGMMFIAWASFTVMLVLLCKISMAQDGTPEIGSTDYLGTVVVTVGRATEQIREVTSNVTVISGAAVELAAADDLAQLIRQQGFYMVDYGASSYIQIRGLNNASASTQDRSLTLVLINGRRTGVTELNQVAMANVERVEIVRGPAAVQYGTAAIGGVINVITKKGQKDTFTATLETGLGSFGLNKDAFSFNGGYGNFDFSGAFSYFERDSITTSKKIGGVRYPHTSAEEKSAMVEVGYTFNELHRFGFNYQYFQSDQEWPTSDYRVYLTGIATGGVQQIGYNLIRSTIRTGGLTYDGSSENGAFDWSLFFSASDYKRPSYNSENIITNFTNQDTINGGFSGGINSKYIDLDLGVDYIRYQIKGVYNGNNVSKDLGLYLTSKIKPFGDFLYISLGGRYDKFDFDINDATTQSGRSRSKSNFSPSLGISYLPLEWLKLRANYSEGFRMPSAFEYVGGNHIGTPTTYHPNPSLLPEESKTYEFGVDVDYRFISASLTYFHTEYKNKIVSRQLPGAEPHPCPGYPMYSCYDDYWYTNIKGATMAGYEFSANADFGQAFDLGFELTPYVSLTYLSKRENNQLNDRNFDGSSILNSVPRYTLAYGITVRHPGIDFQFNANATQMGHFIQRYPPVIIDSEFVALDLSFEKGLWEVGSNGKKGKIKLRVEVKNVLDSRNEPYVEYPGPGRNFYVGLKYVY
jgi:vitamin B12 transporter